MPKHVMTIEWTEEQWLKLCQAAEGDGYEPTDKDVAEWAGEIVWQTAQEATEG